MKLACGSPRRSKYAGQRLVGAEAARHHVACEEVLLRPEAGTASRSAMST